MNAETTKMMQDALEAAVTRLNNGTAEPAPSRVDPIGALMTVLPKLLQHNDSSDELLEKIESLQKTDIAPLREQVLVLRKQCHRILKSQGRLLSKVAEIQRQHTAVAGAVLELAQQIARITFVEDVPAGDDDCEEPPPPDRYRRAEPRAGRNGHGRLHRDT